jgi:hypothetical protein
MEEVVDLPSGMPDAPNSIWSWGVKNSHGMVVFRRFWPDRRHVSIDSLKSAEFVAILALNVE